MKTVLYTYSPATASGAAPVCSIIWDDVEQVGYCEDERGDRRALAYGANFKPTYEYRDREVLVDLVNSMARHANRPEIS